MFYVVIAYCMDIVSRCCIHGSNINHFHHNLSLLSLRWYDPHFLLSRISKLDRNFLYWQITSLIRHLRNT